MVAHLLAQPVLAHQGGWDEFLFAAGPIALIGGLLWLANKRATRLSAGRDTDEDRDLISSDRAATDDGATGEIRG